MNKNIIVLFVLAWASVLWGALPMENVGRYNVILIHGAYGSDKGFELITNDY